MIATSREPLSVDGEHVLPVPPLELPAWMPTSRWTDCARTKQSSSSSSGRSAASGNFQLTGANQAAVVELCRRLDGLPLAIELAAVRTRTLSAEQIRDRLGERFDLLTGGSRAALPRQQTLRTTIEWSYDLLSPAERKLLTWLCVFAGRFTVDDVAEVCGSDDLPPVVVLDHLSSLLDKSLMVKEDAAGAPATGCTRRCANTPGSSYARPATRPGRAALHGLPLDAVQAVRRGGKAPALEWLPWVELRIDTIRAVLRRTLDRDDVPAGVELATYLMRYWITRATTEGARWLDELLAADTQPGSHPHGRLRPRLPRRAAERPGGRACRRSNGACMQRANRDQPSSCRGRWLWRRSLPAWQGTASPRGRLFEEARWSPTV